MEIRLAGFNVNIENILLLKELISDNFRNVQLREKIKNIEWTPEIISASYARISRDPRPIYELREEAAKEVEKARKSNNTIIFEMGHSSIAEHAVFNIDLIDISRLAAEYIEKSRLVSFTEKSQRYIKIGKDSLIPEEFKKKPTLLREYEKLLDELFDSYEIIYEKLLQQIKKEHPKFDENEKRYKELINLAKEDARYILPLSTLTQLGMTINARNLEKMIRKLSSSPLVELNQIAKNLFDVVHSYTPSLVKYIIPDEFEKKDYSFLNRGINNSKKKFLKEVELINIDKNLEDKILIAFFIRHSSLDYKTAKSLVKKLSRNEKLGIFEKITSDIKFYTAVQREFEVCDFEFNIIISASAFAQLKRHRMLTLIDGEYSPELGVTIPESIIKVGLNDFFLEKINKIEKLYYDLKEHFGIAADYVLSNAHRKNVFLKCNLRELIHIFRLRLDKHAQWDIRNIANQMLEKIKSHFHFIDFLLRGKDHF